MTTELPTQIGTGTYVLSNSPLLKVPVLVKPTFLQRISGWARLIFPKKHRTPVLNPRAVELLRAVQQAITAHPERYNQMSSLRSAGLIVGRGTGAAKACPTFFGDDE